MDEQPTTNYPSSLISNKAVQILRLYTGRGPTQARTTIHEDIVIIMLADTLTKGERTLVEAGHAERVITLRQEYQQIMREDLVRVVEGQLDRKVIAFMSQNHIDPDLAVETFVLEPATS